MNGIEKLEILKKRHEELYDLWYAQKKAVTDKLYEILNNLSLGPAPLLPLREHEVVSIERDRYYHPETDWKVRKEIYFVNQDPTRDRDYDFGSTFTLNISNQHITINHGSCGEWGLDDKGQWSRLILMKAIFDHEQDIIDAINPLIDYSVREELSDVSSSIDEINRAIERAQREKEEAAIKATIKVNKYICIKKKDWSTNKYRYVGHEQITKISEKTITTTDPWGCNRRYKIDEIVYKLRSQQLYVVDDKEVTPPEETDPE